MVAKRALSSVAICLGAAALAAAFAVVPAGAKSQKSASTEEELPGHDASQPMTLIVSLSSQKVDMYRGMTLITSSRVSTGKPGYATKPGVFSILEKKRHHYSNLYGGAPMPWMQRLTWSGTALHAGVVPGYPASHGCIRLPYSFAPKLFQLTDVGAQVVVARGSVAPKPIQHAALFQPLPPPMPPMLVKQIEQEPVVKEQSINEAPPVEAPQKRSSNELAPPQVPHLPVILAKAEANAVATDAPEIAVDEHGLTPVETLNVAAAVPSQPGHDTHTHAIDPFAAPPSRIAHGVPVSPASALEVLVAPSALTKGQDRLGGNALPASEAVLPDSGETEASKSEASDAIKVSAVAVPQPNPALVAATISVTAPIPDTQPEPPAGPVLTVLATTMAQPEGPAPAIAMLAYTDPDHPPMPPAKPSALVAKIVAGLVAAGVEAAEPRSTAPLRILVTRRTQRDRMIDVQYMLASMGYLEVQNFDGTFGKLTANAIKDFQKANSLPETGAFTDDVVAKIYEVAGKEEPPAGHLFVRQEFKSVFDTPVGIRNPDDPLGTHVFMVMNFSPEDTQAQWFGISLSDATDPSDVLNRLEIPSDVRQKISERLTPGSSLIVGDTAINSASLPKGADFLVWDTSKPAKVQNASLTPDEVSPRPKKKKRTVRRRTTPSYTQTYRRYPGWPF